MSAVDGEVSLETMGSKRDAQNAMEAAHLGGHLVQHVKALAVSVNKSKPQYHCQQALLTDVNCALSNRDTLLMSLVQFPATFFLMSK